MQREDFFAAVWKYMTRDEDKPENLTGLPLAEQVKRATQLPDKTAILYTSFFIDNTGSIYSSSEALSAIAEVANRPIVIDVDSLVGRGATGGFVLNNVSYGQEVASLALRIIDGVAVSTIPVTVSDFSGHRQAAPIKRNL